MLQIQSTEQLFSEALHIFDQLGVSKRLLSKLISDTVLIYSGQYPSYHWETTYYHDLRHAAASLLTAGRICNALLLDGARLDTQLLLACAIDAALHDIGYIQHESELSGTGAKFSRIHEERGARFLNAYLETAGYSDSFRELCCSALMLTKFTIPVATICPAYAERPENNFQDLLVRVLISADLLSQLSDRYYLDKLPFLYLEMLEGETSADDIFDFFSDALSFYSTQALPRIQHCLGPVYQALISQSFTSHDGAFVDESYATRIDKNVSYLETVLREADGQGSAVIQRLRRRLDRSSYLPGDVSSFPKNITSFADATVFFRFKTSLPDQLK